MQPEDLIERAVAARTPGPLRLLLGLGLGEGGRYRGAWRWTVLLLLVYGLVLVILFPVSPTAPLTGDSWEYQSMAVNFAAGHGLKTGAIEPLGRYAFADGADPARVKAFLEQGKQGGRDNFYRTPGYPFLLGLLYKTVGVRPDLAKRIQMGMLACIAALLPVLGNALAGRRGFYAGLLGGVLFLAVNGYMGRNMLTEPLMAFSAFLVLGLWLLFNRFRESALLAGLLGLSCTGLLLVKGSFLFAPLLLLAYLGVRRSAYPRRAATACLLAFALSLGAYSLYASVRTGSLVLLSTQSRAVLLDGNNELTLRDGGWNKEWRDNPNSFYNTLIRQTGKDSSLFLLKEFFARNWRSIPLMVRNKLHDGFHRDPVLNLWAVLTFLVCVAYPFRGRPGPMLGALGIGGAGLAALSLSLGSLFVAGLALSLAAGALCLVSRGGRSRAAELWRSPLAAGSAAMIGNFLLVVILFFGDLRFIQPMDFLFYTLAAHHLLALWGLVAEARDQETGGYADESGPEEDCCDEDGSAGEAA